MKTSEHQQVRSDGDVTLAIEKMDDNWWFWSVTKNGKYITGDDCGDYAHDEKTAKILAEFYAI